MATIGGYVSATLARFGLTLTAVELETLLLDYELEPDTEYSSETSVLAKWAIVAYIPLLLAIPDVTEDGYARKYDRGAIIKFCSILAGTIGAPDPFAEPNGDNVMDASFIW